MKFDWLVNFDAVNELVGTVYGVANEANNPVYKMDLIRAAHYSVSKLFDEAAAATAMAGNFPHMWEYGVPGITKGPARYSDPTAPSARLYVHALIPDGGAGAAIEFTFREAVMRNPQPTTASTGVPSKYLRFLSKRKYVFRRRAEITEQGETVHLHSESGRKLFVPFYGQPRDDAANNRGYMMYPGEEGMDATPGAQVRGNFGTFWKSWWEATGQAAMAKHMQKNYNLDVERTMKLAALKSKANQGLVPVRAEKTTPVVAAAKRRAEAGMQTTATRRKRERH